MKIKVFFAVLATLIAVVGGAAWTDGANAAAWTDRAAPTAAWTD